MSKAVGLRASQVSIILGALLALLICLLLASSAFIGATLLQKSNAATDAQIDAQVSGNYPSQMEALKKYLADNTDGINQTAALTAGIGNYDQNAIISTINGYAARAGVSITGISFGTPGAGRAGGAASPAPLPANGNSINLSLSSPLPYKNFIIFLQLLEHGTMPVQITGGQVGPDSDNADTVSVTGLSVQVAQ